MIESPRDEVTRLLQAIAHGQQGADDELMARLYSELRNIARAELGAQRGQTLHPTALVHEVYLRLIERDPSTWDSRRNFFFAAARAMRDLVVETARRKAAIKRGQHWQRTELDSLTILVEASDVDVLALDEALERLKQECSRQYDLVQLRFFGGLTAPQAAQVLGVSLRTVERDWRLARARLHLDISGVSEAHGESS